MIIIISILTYSTYYYFEKYIIYTFFEIAKVRIVLYDGFNIIINCLSV